MSKLKAHLITIGMISLFAIVIVFMSWLDSQGFIEYLLGALLLAFCVMGYNFIYTMIKTGE